MVLFHKVAFSAAAAAIAAGAGLINSAAVEPPHAYGAPAIRLEADAAARQAARTFDRTDLNNDGALDDEEYTVLAVVTAELARLNGFVSVDINGEVRTVVLSNATPAFLTDTAKASIRDRASREFAYIAGDDERLMADEFVAAQLETFLASDGDRNAVLTGAELGAFAQRQSRLESKLS